MNRHQLSQPRAAAEEPCVEGAPTAVRDGVDEELLQEQLWIYTTGRWRDRSSDTIYDPASPMESLKPEIERMDASVPEGWVWVNEWSFQRTRFTDEEGWEYAQTFGSMSNKKDVRKRKEDGWDKCVRRRKCVRTRVPMSSDLAKKEARREQPEVILPRLIMQLETLARLRSDFQTTLGVMGTPEESHKTRILQEQAISMGEELKQSVGSSRGLLLEQIQGLISDLRECGSKYKSSALKCSNDYTREEGLLDQAFAQYAEKLRTCPAPPVPLEDENLTDEQIAMALQKEMKSEVELTSTIITERRNAILRLNEDLRLLNETMKDVAVVVKEQGEIVEKIVDRTQDSADLAKRGFQDIMASSTISNQRSCSVQ